MLTKQRSSDIMQQRNNEIKEVQFPNAIFLPEIVKLINEGHTVTLQLKGYSMRPFLENNRDKALLTRPTDLKVGYPVLAEIRQGFYVLHRIINIDKENNIVTLRGDGNIATETCKQEGIKGLAIGFYRKGRKEIDSIEGQKWKVYSFLWTHLFPIRRYLLFIYRKLFV